MFELPLPLAAQGSPGAEGPFMKITGVLAWSLGK